MARQLRIAGTGQPGISEALTEASEDLLEKRRDKRRIMKTQNDLVAKAEWKVLTLMQQDGIKTHKIKDAETEELLNFNLEQVLKISKTGEVESEEGEEDGDSTPPTDAVHPGLISMAEKAQADVNVEETPDGDVTVPDTAAPSSKKKRGGKKAK